MPAHALAIDHHSVPARLLIHAQADSAERGWSVEGMLQRLRGRRLAELHAGRLPIGLEIKDFEGRRVLSLDAAGPLVDVALVPGTYHVSAEQGGVRRSYTVALAPGATFDLHVRTRHRHP